MLTPDWFEDAACRTLPKEIFFREESLRDDRAAHKEAKTICHSCSVRDECLEFAIARAEPFGIWGGMTASQRRSYAKKNNIQMGRPSIEWATEFQSIRARSARFIRLEGEIGK